MNDKLNNNFPGFSVCLCIVEQRQRGRFAGFSIYVSNTGDIEGSTLCYKDGPELPPLNFTTTCTEYGRYVIFYNERMDEVVYPDSYQLTNVYTELCEVIVKGKLYILDRSNGTTLGAIYISTLTI